MTTKYNVGDTILIPYRISGIQSRMKITVELNESDICQIIAEHYNNLTQEDVNLFVAKEAKRYGLGEYEAKNIVKATIEFNSKGEAGACLICPECRKKMISAIERTREEIQISKFGCSMIPVEEA